MYKKDEIKLSESAEIKAIRLWSDWNLGLKNWAEEKVKTVKNNVLNLGFLIFLWNFCMTHKILKISN